MRWKEKPLILYGTQKIKTTFLFLPMCFQGEWRWLEMLLVYMNIKNIMDGH